MNSFIARARESSVSIAIAASMMAICLPSFSAQNNEAIYLPIEVPANIEGTSQEDANARSDFKVSDQVARQYLVVTLEVTKTGITPVGSSLVRGPGRLTNGAIKDLQIRAFDTTKMIAAYSIRDPRFTKREQNRVGGRPRWVELPAAKKNVFVPLSSEIENVEVIPEAARSGIVSPGGNFDPRPWGTAACVGHDPDLFPNCAAILALGIPPP